MKLAMKKNIVGSVLYSLFLVMTLIKLFTVYGCIFSIITSIVVLAVEFSKENNKTTKQNSNAVSLFRMISVNIFLFFTCCFFKYVDFETFGKRIEKFATPIGIYFGVCLGLIIISHFLKLNNNPVKLFIKYATTTVAFIWILSSVLKNLNEIIILSVLINIIFYLFELSSIRVATSNAYVFFVAQASNFLLLTSLLINKSFRTIILNRINSFKIFSWSIWNVIIVAIIFVALSAITYELDYRYSSKIETRDYINIILIGYNIIFFMFVDMFRSSYSALFLGLLIIYDIIIIYYPFDKDSKKIGTRYFKNVFHSNKFIIVIITMISFLLIIYSFINGVIDLAISIILDFIIIAFSENKKKRYYIEAFVLYLTSMLLCFRFYWNEKAIVLISMIFLISFVSIYSLNSKNDKYEKELESFKLKVIISLLILVFSIIPIVLGVSCKGLNDIKENTDGKSYVTVSCADKEKINDISEAQYYWNFEMDKKKELIFNADGECNVKIPDEKNILVVVLTDKNGFTSRYVHLY